MDRDTILLASVSAFREAIVRWEAHWAEGNAPVQAFAPLTEVLWWACALDEAFGKDDPLYKKRRDKDPDGEVMHGLRWARNQTNHALAAVRTDGPESDDPWDLVDLIWERAARVPRGEREDGPGEVAYIAHLEGRAVVDTLRAVRSWLMSAWYERQAGLTPGRRE